MGLDRDFDFEFLSIFLQKAMKGVLVIGCIWERNNIFEFDTIPI